MDIVMLENGYTRGVISSYDGFFRNLDERDVSYSFHIFDRVGQDIYPAAVMEYNGPESLGSQRKVHGKSVPPDEGSLQKNP